MMIVRAFALAAAVMMTGSGAFAVDQSARDAGPRSPVEMCCAETAPLPPIETSVAPDRHALLDLSQTAPVTRATPGLDGADWNCRRPDGSLRCFSSLRGQ
jgi:hypothetical protein